jgi:hypothetical protein
MTTDIQSERVALLRKRVDKLVNNHELIKGRLVDANNRLTEARARQVDLDVVQNTVQYVAARVQTSFGNHVGGLVTKAIHHVFPSKRSENFIVRFRENRGKTECELRMRTEKGEEAHPFDCCGGGVWDVISFALRCACLVLEQPANTRFLVLDEPFKFIHGWEMRSRALQMLYNTCKALNIQAVVVHQTDDVNDAEGGLDVLAGRDGCKVYLVKQAGYELSEVVPC